jgi:hypothetical protein
MDTQAQNIGLLPVISVLVAVVCQWLGRPRPYQWVSAAFAIMSIMALLIDLRTDPGSTTVDLTDFAVAYLLSLVLTYLAMRLRRWLRRDRPRGGHSATPDGRQVTPATDQPGQLASRPYNKLAVAAMICSLAGVLVVTAIGFQLGAILGHVSLRQARHYGQRGAGFAKAGIMIGWIGTSAIVVSLIVYAALGGR